MVLKLKGNINIDTKGIGFVPKLVSTWPRKQNISVLVDTNVSLWDYLYVYICVCIYLCKYEFINFYVYQHNILSLHIL